MARSKKPPVDVDQAPDSSALPVLKESNEDIASINETLRHSTRGLLAAGRLQMATFFQTVGEKAIVETYLELKNNKAYKDLPYIDQEGNSRRVGTLEEFCRVFLGKSGERCRELAQNYQLIGEDLYSKAEQIGFRQRDYRAIKALPEDDQRAVREAIESEADRDQLLELIEDLNARHAAREQEQRDKIADQAEQLDAREQVLGKKTERVTQLEEELEATKRRVAKAQPDEVVAELRQAIGERGFHAASTVRGDLRLAIEQLVDKDVLGEHEPYLAGVLADIERAVIEVREQLGISAAPEAIDSDAMAWVDQAKQAQELN